MMGCLFFVALVLGVVWVLEKLFPRK